MNMQNIKAWVMAMVLAFAFASHGSTVVCTNLIDSLGVVSGVQRVTFTPTSRIPQQYGNQTVLPKQVGADCDTNSGFSANIIAGGVYSIGFIPQNSYVQAVTGLVPSNDTNTYTLNQIIGFATNKNYFLWTNSYPPLLAGTNIVFTTNGAYLVINSTSTGSGSSYTNNNGVVGVISGSGIGTNTATIIGWGNVSNSIKGSASMFFYFPTNTITSNNYPHGILTAN